MSNSKHSDLYFANHDTICRRTWVEKALAGVREMASGRVSIDDESIEIKKKKRRPSLYIVNSNTSG